MEKLKRSNIQDNSGEGTIIHRLKLCSLKDLWETLYYQGPIGYSPFSSYEFIRLWLHLYSGKKSRRRFTPYFFLFSEQGQNYSILCFSIDHKRKQIIDISCYGPIDYFDVISSTSDIDFICRGLVSFLGLYADYDISLENINHRSLLFKVFENKQLSVKPDTCVNIKLIYPSFQDFYLTLSKQQRQNYRTYQNRIARDHLTIDFSVFSRVNSKISAILWIKCIIIYIKRTLVKNHISRRNIKTIISILRNNIFDPINWSPILSNHLIFVLFLNNKPAGYCACMHEPSSKTIFIPRIAFDEKYQYYDPGNMLLYRVIDYSITKGITEIDLTRGDEQYKYRLGGQEHYNYSFHGHCSDLIKELL